MRALFVNRFAVWLDNVSGDIARYFQQLLIVFDGVLVVNGCVVVFVFIFKVALFQLNNSFHQRVMKVELQLGRVQKVICHNLLKRSKENKE